ncbi:MAG: HAD-superfamily hydrolase, subfamily variant 3 [Flavipsychrobacter sp.]|jgi:putative hydrolase of the HAD superfamily|nr:HAD-superfamily hydrolase, subfamily variant 3 [Flavipsychrobacter sp.]
MIKGIRHIIFDLGGVLLNIDYKLTEQAFIKAGIANFTELYSQLNQTELFDKFEMGLLRREEFLTSLIENCGQPVTEAQVIKSWNAMLLDFPLRRLQLLQQLHLYYDLFLLSNTNEIHEAAFNDILYRSHGLPNIGVLFDKVYFSHRLGLRKPMKEIFERVLDDNGLKAENTLFIDDSPQHIEGAKQLGIQTIYLEPGMTIEDNVFKTLNP